MSDIPPRRHRRHRALTELERLVTAAEATRARLLAAGDATARGATFLTLVEERLALLRRSRETLLANDGRTTPPAGDETDGTTEDSGPAEHGAGVVTGA